MKQSLIVAVSLLVLMLCAACDTVTSNAEVTKACFEVVSDRVDMVHNATAMRERLFAYYAEKQQAEQEAAAQAEQEEQYVEYYEPVHYAPTDNGDGFVSQGVRDYNGTTETWYSSNQTYHHRTGEWTADDEGYYRDSDGYYVVASEDHVEGEVFDTSKGKAKVYDGGCDSGVTDFYTNF